jgi:hypothetical protein
MKRKVCSKCEILIFSSLLFQGMRRRTRPHVVFTDRNSPNIFVDASLSDNEDQIIPMESLVLENQSCPVGASAPMTVKQHGGIVRRACSEALLTTIGVRQPAKIRIVPGNELLSTGGSSPPFLEIPLIEERV